jgi:hypothetical protein
LGDGHEGAPRRVQALDQPDEVGKGAGQAVDLVNHHHVDPTRIDVGQQAL